MPSRKLPPRTCHLPVTCPHLGLSRVLNQERVVCNYRTQQGRRTRWHTHEKGCCTHRRFLHFTSNQMHWLKSFPRQLVSAQLKKYPNHNSLFLHDLQLTLLPTKHLQEFYDTQSQICFEIHWKCLLQKNFMDFNFLYQK